LYSPVVYDEEIRPLLKRRQASRHRKGTAIRTQETLQSTKSNEDQHPQELYPIVKDPTLVKAAQLALEDLKQSHQDLIWVIRMYYGIKAAFDELLVTRLNRNHGKEE